WWRPGRAAGTRSRPALPSGEFEEDVFQGGGTHPEGSGHPLFGEGLYERARVNGTEVHLAGLLRHLLDTGKLPEFVDLDDVRGQFHARRSFQAADEFGRGVHRDHPTPVE